MQPEDCSAHLAGSDEVRDGWHRVRAWAPEPARQGLVSVVICVFNGAEFLLSALDSVRRQLYPSWEVVVIDDGSTDESGSIARAVASDEGRVRVFEQPNAGICAARNRALLECHGEYIQFLDADDQLCPDKLQAQVAYLEAHPETDIVTADSACFGPSGRVPLREIAPPASNLIADLLLRNIAGGIEAPLARRRMFARVGGFKSRMPSGARVYGCEDWELWLRAVFAGCRLDYVPGVVVHNYWHAGNAQHNRVRMLEGALWALSESGPAVPRSYKPWWALSVLEKRLQLRLAQSAHGDTLTDALAGLWCWLGRAARPRLG